MKTQYIVILITVLVAIAALSLPAMADYDANGYAFPIATANNSTIYGEIYVGGGHGVEGNSHLPNTYYQNFNVPSGTVEWARLYVGVWGGKETYDGHFNAIFNGQPLPPGDIWLRGVNDNNSNVWCTGHGVYWIYFDVTDNVTAGTINNAVANTWDTIPVDFDGRMYGIVLVAAVSNQDGPEVQYWINDGHWNLNSPGHNSNTTYFYGNVPAATDKSASLYTVYLTGNIGDADSLSFNNQLVAMDAADGCGEDEWGNSWCYCFDVDCWDVSEHLSSSGNYATYNRGGDPYLHPVVAVLTIKDPEWVFKNEYDNHAPSGMPDFDQKQDNWENAGQWSFCGPTAVANCLWWFDSKYANQTGTPGDGWDNFSLVRDYNETPPLNPGPNWDDHAFDNVNDLGTVWPAAGAPPALPPFTPGPQPQPPLTVPRWGELVERLAWYVNTDGVKSGNHSGTKVLDMEQGINDWLNDTGQDNLLYVHVEKAPNATWIKNEVVKCEDVILLLGFWQLNETWKRIGGHYVTTAGVNYSANACMLALSDPYFDNNVTGNGPGRHHPSNHPLIYLPDYHNDAQYVSHDFYLVSPSESPGGVDYTVNYPVGPTSILDFQGMNVPNDLAYHQGNYDSIWPIHTEIEYAIAVSPKPIPDLEITKTWVNWTENVGCDCTIKYVVENVGEFSSRGNFTNALYVNDLFGGLDLVTYGLQPGETFESSFGGYTWTYTPPDDDIAVCADYNDVVEETEEENWLNVTWECGDVNNDKAVNILDVIQTYTKAPGINEWAADVNSDTKINILDVIKIYKKSGLDCFCD